MIEPVAVIGLNRAEAWLSCIMLAEHSDPHMSATFATRDKGDGLIGCPEHHIDGWASASSQHL